MAPQLPGTEVTQPPGTEHPEQGGSLEQSPGPALTGTASRSGHRGSSPGTCPRPGLDWAFPCARAPGPAVPLTWSVCEAAQTTHGPRERNQSVLCGRPGKERPGSAGDAARALSLPWPGHERPEPLRASEDRRPARHCPPPRSRGSESGTVWGRETQKEPVDKGEAFVGQGVVG